MKLDVLFKEKPLRWGLRGDPNLWDELEKLLREVDAVGSGEELFEYLKTLIERSIGQQLIEGEYPYVERFNSGGMSGGHIDCGFWLNTALPLLVQRFKHFYSLIV